MAGIAHGFSIAAEAAVLGFADATNPSIWIVAVAGVAIGLIARFRRDD
jgi:hypothetical protein